MHNAKIGKWPLPPKRFESAEGTRYDPIRGRSWFPRLLKRKWQLPRLSMAARYYRNGETQQEAADEFGVDVRELRDYVNFINGGVKPRTKTDQAILDDAHHHYLEDGAELHLRAYITSSAKQFGVNPRPVIELWETDPFFLPTGIRKET